MIWVGVDPGRSGAMVFVPDLSTPWQVRLNESAQDISGALADAMTVGPCYAVLESVHSTPQMGVKSAFSFGQAYGQVEALLIAHKCPYEKVSPQRWQKDLGCMTRGDKNVTKAAAASLFPNMRIIHANADAFLLAAWGKKYSRVSRKGYC
tara:strand:+ start:6484 stop:6933 length:450 start_codon:yes stop_codon:yes gene_type:complete